MNCREYCFANYSTVYEKIFSEARGNEEQKERVAQKMAIIETVLSTIKEFKEITAVEAWKMVCDAHMTRKTGLSISIEEIQTVISAENSWKKSSGHAFEEIIKNLANNSLHSFGIEFLLQRELSKLITEGNIHNESRDVDWLSAQIRASNFDLFGLIRNNDKNLLFACIQSKTSIRDRVTRDREPSGDAMDHFFWSIAFVLDGDFLKLPKFQSMVNGGSASYPENGWHGLYVFSDEYTLDRIYPLDMTFKVLTKHAVQASKQWLEQRQWLRRDWKA